MATANAAIKKKKGEWHLHFYRANISEAGSHSPQFFDQGLPVCTLLYEETSDYYADYFCMF